MGIDFNKPFTTGKEFRYIAEAIQNSHLSGDGVFTKKCHLWLEDKIKCARAFLTHSCTAALEMSAILAGIGPGDEVIMPSYTFVSTANPFVLRGGVPVFVDIRPDTLNIDEKKIEAAITPRTKAIVPVHYAGVGCEMDVIMEIARKHNLIVIEDVAHGIMSSYKGRPLGSFGHMAALSFHETKNVISGEGGALLVNDRKFIERAEVIREKGTNRSKFFRGEVDKYSWVDIGSSYLPSDILAAFLWAQLEKAHHITKKRLDIWGQYHNALAQAEKRGLLRRPVVPDHCSHNAHMYYILVKDIGARSALLGCLKSRGINAVFHYVPLHSSPAGRRYGRADGSLAVTDEVSARVVRLPLWINIGKENISRIVSCVCEYLELSKIT